MSVMSAQMGDDLLTHANQIGVEYDRLSWTRRLLLRMIAPEFTAMAQWAAYDAWEQTTPSRPHPLRPSTWLR